MIDPIACWTCGNNISQYFHKYKELVSCYKIDDLQWFDDKLSKPNKDELKELDKFHTPEFKALAKLGIWKQCCRSKFICKAPEF